jgi:CelD/BcsL family acetyltransferase involved in cellulose biosynthesis
LDHTLTEWRTLPELASIRAQWQALVDRAIEPNVFYEPDFALAAVAAFGTDVGAVLVWSMDASARLLGFFPARIERRRYGVPMPVLVGWTHPYGPLGAPLIDCDCAEAVIGAWLDHLDAAASQLPKLVLLPYLPVAGPIANALERQLAQRRGSFRDFAVHARALLAPSGERAGYLASAIDRKKRKELRRQRNRLAETGAVTLAIASTPAAVASALDDFLALEALGWKGRAGTAARCHDAIATFMRSAVTALAAQDKARVACLSVGERAIAALVTLRSAQSTWCWKIAYDEAFARFSPGVQLVLDVTQALVADPRVVRADSCATPDHPMIDHIWRERLALADRLIGIAPKELSRFRLACTLEALRRKAIQAAKTARHLVRVIAFARRGRITPAGAAGGG